MKESIEFLKSELEKLSNKFEDALIRYEYIEKTNLHLIEVKPYDLYDNIEYLEAEEKLEKDFEDKFPNERFLYLGEFPLFEINEAIVEFGYESKIVRRIIDFDWFNNSIINYPNKQNINYKEVGYYTSENNYTLAA